MTTHVRQTRPIYWRLPATHTNILPRVGVMSFVIYPPLRRNTPNNSQTLGNEFDIDSYHGTHQAHEGDENEKC
jgi:hypothetical protein